jgi:hypothetical protein
LTVISFETVDLKIKKFKNREKMLAEVEAHFPRPSLKGMPSTLV